MTSLERDLLVVYLVIDICGETTSVAVHGLIDMRLINIWARSRAEAVERDLLVVYPVFNIRGETKFVAVHALINMLLGQHQG